jgi:hypothetical protein
LTRKQFRFVKPPQTLTLTFFCFSSGTIGSVVLIVLGIGVACTTEFHFTWVGFLTAAMSNLLFSIRTVYSKQVQNLTPIIRKQEEVKQKIVFDTKIHQFAMISNLQIFHEKLLHKKHCPIFIAFFLTS